MEENSVDFEDALTPIAYLDGEFYFFNARDGRIYRLGNSFTPHMLSLPLGSFAVPGDESIYCPRVSGKTLRVKLRSVADATHEKDFLLGEGYDSPPIAVIPDGADRRIVLRRKDQSEVTLVSLNTREASTHYLPPGARPLFIKHDGHLVYQYGQSWGSACETCSSEPGIVSSWSSERFIVVSDTKGRRIYTEINDKTRRILMAPQGWEIRQVVTYIGGTLFICLHPSLGYALWDERNFTCLKGIAVLYALGEIMSPSCELQGALLALGGKLADGRSLAS